METRRLRHSVLAVALALALAAVGCDSDSPDDGGTDSSADTDGSGMDSADSNASASGASGSSASGSGASGSGASDTGDSDTGSSASTTGDVDPGDDLGQACVDRINMFRATLDLPPYARWSAGEACADDQSRADAEAGGAHANFGVCEEWAQNTCPNWPNETAVIQDCFQLMWDEGPGEDYNLHGHYLAMSSTDYTEVACGFHENPDGTIWANQNFR